MVYIVYSNNNLGWVDRRAGVASALLGAAERMAGKWQQNWVLLHVYGDNFPGLRLYHRNGCEPASICPSCQVHGFCIKVWRDISRSIHRLLLHVCSVYYLLL